MLHQFAPLGTHEVGSVGHRPGRHPRVEEQHAADSLRLKFLEVACDPFSADQIVQPPPVDPWLGLIGRSAETVGQFIHRKSAAAERPQQHEHQHVSFEHEAISCQELRFEQAPSSKRMAISVALRAGIVPACMRKMHRDSRSMAAAKPARNRGRDETSFRYLLDCLVTSAAAEAVVRSFWRSPSNMPRRCFAAGTRP